MSVFPQKRTCVGALIMSAIGQCCYRRGALGRLGAGSLVRIRPGEPNFPKGCGWRVFPRNGPCYTYVTPLSHPWPGCLWITLKQSYRAAKTGSLLVGLARMAHEMAGQSQPSVSTMQFVTRFPPSFGICGWSRVGEHRQTSCCRKLCRPMCTGLLTWRRWMPW
jgi:hypothetical protein